MTELKPCPFCGGKAMVFHDEGEYLRPYYVGCDNDECLGFSKLGWTYVTEEEAANAWNTRHEPTCTMEHEERKPYVHLGKWTCSQCGAWWMRPPYDLSAANYCPNCGSRVVDGDAS